MNKQYNFIIAVCIITINIVGFCYIITVKVIPNMEEIEAKYGKDLSDEKIYNIIWEKIKEVNQKLTSYKAIKKLEIKKDEFVKTTTMKIKRYVEINKDK